MKVEFNFENPYQPDGSPRTDLPTGEVLAWDGKEWANGFLERIAINKIALTDEGKNFICLQNVVRFAPLPTIIESDDLL